MVYCDSADGQVPMESVITKDLIPKPPEQAERRLR